jgi:hypothetical protein
VGASHLPTAAVVGDVTAVKQGRSLIIAVMSHDGVAEESRRGPISSLVHSLSHQEQCRGDLARQRRANVMLPSLCWCVGQDRPAFVSRFADTFFSRNLSTRVSARCRRFRSES